METINLLVISETLMERSEDGTLYELENSDQYIAYRDRDSLEEHLENEWNKDVYDGEFDSDYDTWLLSSHNDFLDDDDLYKGFERTFITDDGKEVIYKVTIETALLVD